MIRIENPQNEKNAEENAKEIFKVIKEGGLALFPDGIGYGLVGNSPEAVKNIYSIKKRPLTKHLVHYMNKEYVGKVSSLDSDDRSVVDKISESLPCCFVLPLKKSQYFARLDDYVFKQSTKDGTVALFFENDDLLVKKLLEMSTTEDLPLIVSSANRSCDGNAYRFEDVPDEIKRICDIAVYSQQSSKYEPKARIENSCKKLGSTLVKLPEREIIREGVFSTEIKRILERLE